MTIEISESEAESSWTWAGILKYPSRYHIFIDAEKDGPVPVDILLTDGKRTLSTSTTSHTEGSHTEALAKTPKSLLSLLQIAVASNPPLLRLSSSQKNPYLRVSTSWGGEFFAGVKVDVAHMPLGWCQGAIDFLRITFQRIAQARREIADRRRICENIQRDVEDLSHARSVMNRCATSMDVIAHALNDYRNFCRERAEGRLLS